MSSFIPIVSSSPPPLDEGPSLDGPEVHDEAGWDDFTGFTGDSHTSTGDGFFAPIDPPDVTSHPQSHDEGFGAFNEENQPDGNQDSNWANFTSAPPEPCEFSAMDHDDDFSNFATFQSSTSVQSTGSPVDCLVQNDISGEQGSDYGDCHGDSTDCHGDSRDCHGDIGGSDSTDGPATDSVCSKHDVLSLSSPEDSLVNNDISCHGNSASMRPEAPEVTSQGSAADSGLSSDISPGPKAGDLSCDFAAKIDTGVISRDEEVSNSDSGTEAETIESASRTPPDSDIHEHQQSETIESASRTPPDSDIHEHQQSETIESASRTPPDSDIHEHQQSEGRQNATCTDEQFCDMTQHDDVDFPESGRQPECSNGHGVNITTPENHCKDVHDNSKHESDLEVTAYQVESGPSSMTDHTDGVVSAHEDSSMTDHTDGVVSAHEDSSMTDHTDGVVSAHEDSSMTDHTDGVVSALEDSSMTDHTDGVVSALEDSSMTDHTDGVVSALEDSSMHDTVMDNDMQDNSESSTDSVHQSSSTSQISDMTSQLCPSPKHKPFTEPSPITEPSPMLATSHKPCVDQSAESSGNSEQSNIHQSTLDHKSHIPVVSFSRSESFSEGEHSEESPEVSVTAQETEEPTVPTCSEGMLQLNGSPEDDFEGFRTFNEADDEEGRVSEPREPEILRFRTPSFTPDEESPVESLDLKIPVAEVDTPQDDEWGTDFADFQDSAPAEDSTNQHLESSGWAAFGESSETPEHEGDNWAAFGATEEVQGTTSTHVSSGPDLVLDDDDDDDEFGDFGGFEDAPTKTTSVLGSNITSASILQTLGQESDIEDLLKRGLPQKDVLAPQLLEILLLLPVMVRQNLKQPITSVKTPPVTTGATQKAPAKVAMVDLCVWNNLEDLNSTAALKYTWINSSNNHKLLMACNVDTRNILLGHKKPSVPIFYQQAVLEPSRGPLEPQKDDILSPRIEPLVSDTATTPVSSPVVTDGVARVNTPVGGNPIGAATPQDIPPAEFDWSTSGLTNPLDASSRVHLDLDFFIQKDSILGRVSIHNSKALQQEQEILEALETPAGTRPQPPKTLQSIETILAGMKFTPTTPVTSSSRDETLSSEAQLVLGALPDFSFMHASVLMFPLQVNGDNE